MATEYRDEQMWAGEIIQACLPSRFKMYYEYELTDLRDIQKIKGKFAKPDIVLIDEVRGQKIAIRMNGGIHRKRLQKIKDEDQKTVMEGNGWKVVDFNEDDMPNLWSNDRVDNSKKAYREVLDAILFIWE